MKCQISWTMLKWVTVEPVLFLYMMLIFLETNALQELISIKSCLKIINPVNISDCSGKNHSNFTYEIEQEKTYWSRYNGAFLFFFTFLSSFYVASWSDKFGRKLCMLIPPIGTIVAASINCVVSSFIYSDIKYLFLSSTVSGLTFGTVGMVAATCGFVSDISNESTRTQRMMILEAMIYSGGTVGTYISGEFLKQQLNSSFNGFSQLFIFEITVAFFITLYIIFRIPNHRNYMDEHSQISCYNLFQLDHIANTVKTVFRARDAGKRKVVLLLLFALFLIFFGLVVQFTLAYYFLQDVLHWDFQKYSGYNSMQFAIEGSALLLGMPIFLHCLKVPDHFIAVLGILSKMTGFIVFGLGKSDFLTYSCLAWFMLSEYPIPAIRSILSKTVDVDEKGRIFAFTTMVQNLCFLLGSVSLTSIYRSTLTIFPGMCFEIVAVLQGIALLLIIYLYFTRGEVITTYEIMENDDRSLEER